MTLLLRNVLIGLVLVLMVGTGLTSFMGDFVNEYGVSSNSNVTDTLGGFNESSLNTMYTWSKGFQNDTQTEEGIGESGGEIVMTSNSFKILKQAFNLFPTVWNMVNRVAKDLEIPIWALTGFFIVSMVIIVLVVTSPIFRKDT